MVNEQQVQENSGRGEAVSGMHERPTQVDLISSAVVLSGMSIAWFFWGSSDGIAVGLMRLGALVCAGLLVLSIVRVRGARGPSTMATDPRARRLYWIGTGAEIVAIPLALAALNALDRPELGPAAVLAIVALHFAPLATGFNMTDLWWIIAACFVVVGASLVAYLAGADGVRAIAGGGGGLVLGLGAVKFHLLARTR